MILLIYIIFDTFYKIANVAQASYNQRVESDYINIALHV